MTNFCEIELTNICPNPKNPRRHYDQKKLDELTASVKQKGVIEPIIVRPAPLRKEAKGKVKDALVEFEIVAGERRYRAAVAAGLATIPAIVRELSDDEAYDFMLIENLQRDDLTDREEAESFKAYIGRHDEGGIVTLAEKTGISPAYIRARVKVLELPVRILKAWDQGKFVFGHLQQLLRVADDEANLKKKIEWLEEQSRWEERPPTVRDLREEIDGDAPALSSAFFKSGETCRACPSNSTVQKSLFDLEVKRALCLNPECFKKRQAEWLTENWKTTAIAKKNKTNGFRFREDVGYNGCHDFNDWGRRPGKKCSSCPNFVSVIDLAGKERDDRACAGDKPCYEAATNPKSDKEKATGERDPEAPRAAWHGEFFRDVFLSKRIPDALAKLDPGDPKIKVLLLACAVHGNRTTLSMRNNSAGLLVKSPAELQKVYKAVIEKVVLDGQHVGDSEYNGFGTKGRQLVADYLGIDLAKEFAVDAEYLDKKTKAEILAFGKKFKLFDKNVDPPKLKKSELVKVVLAHGAKLIGMVPAEILK